MDADRWRDMSTEELKRIQESYLAVIGRVSRVNTIRILIKSLGEIRDELDRRENEQSEEKA